LELNSKGHDAQRDRRLRWSSIEKGNALRDIVASIELQVRDVVLAGIEENVTNQLLKRMDAALRPTVRQAIVAQAVKQLPAPEVERKK
jgi:adenosyl cobinamide kinase/adenosyl cobinamide phosphate guanylyltransferase